MEDLRPIKPLEHIPDMSYFVFIGVVGLLVVSIALILGIVATRWWSIRKENLSKKYLSILKQTDWSNPKRAAYSVTYYGRLLAKERQSIEIFEQLLPLLEPYKYKKDIPPLDTQVLRQFELFVQVLDGSI